VLRPLALVGMATDKTSFDLAMTVNQVGRAAAGCVALTALDSMMAAVKLAWTTKLFFEV
jgi:hypothetical protein